jgi:hypothetical protein
MNRRAILAGITVLLAPRSLIAQTASRDGPRRLGVLMGNLANDPVGQTYTASLMQGLRALDWHEGGNLRIDWRWAGGDPALFDRYATELVELGCDVLLAQSSPSVVALRRKTSTIPIVFTMVTDPIGQGFVENLARPGGNITGFSDFNALMAGKWLEMLTQVAPPVARVAVLYNPATAPYAGLMMRAIEDAAPFFAITAQSAPCHDAAEIQSMMAEPRGARRIAGFDGYFYHRASRYHPRFRRAAPPPYRLFRALVHHGRRPDVLWHRLCRAVPSLGRLYRSYSEGRRPARLAGPAANQVRTGDQPQDRQSARH